jgi:acetylcholinesterase
VDNYNFAYPDDSIVSGFIMNSGSSLLTLISGETQQTNFTFVAQHFGCNSTDPETKIDCLRGISSVDIERFLKTYSGNGTTPALSFLPMIENRTQFASYTDELLQVASHTNQRSLVQPAMRESILYLLTKRMDMIRRTQMPQPLRCSCVLLCRPHATGT